MRSAPPTAESKSQQPPCSWKGDGKRQQSPEVRNRHLPRVLACPPWLIYSTPCHHPTRKRQIKTSHITSPPPDRAIRQTHEDENEHFVYRDRLQLSHVPNAWIFLIAGRTSKARSRKKWIPHTGAEEEQRRWIREALSSSSDSLALLVSASFLFLRARTVQCWYRCWCRASLTCMQDALIDTPCGGPI